MRKIEMIGQVFGRLTVLSRADVKNGQIYYNCICECGNTTKVRGDLLRKGKTSSCGCLLKQSCSEFGDRVKKHWIIDGVEYGSYELCKKYGFSVSTFYRYLAKYPKIEECIEAILNREVETPSPSEQDKLELSES